MNLQLLNPQDPHPVRYCCENRGGGPFVLVGDHAGAAIPAALGSLGLPPEELRRHIALDLGVEEMGRAMAEILDAPFVSQAYSRLVVDCNRHPGDPEWAATESDGTAIAANADLSPVGRAAREGEIFEPYHAAIAALLDDRTAAGRETIFVSLHSFTPAMGDTVRPWEIGILHDGHRDEFALRLLERLRAGGRAIGDNEPYRMDATDYTVPRHAYPRDLPYVEIEVRQDILGEQSSAIVALLCDALREARQTG